MIQVRVLGESSAIRVLEISGHALFDNPGKDIVCAGVSAIAFGSMNAIDILAPQSCGFDLTRERIRISVQNDQPDVQLLLQMLLIELETVAESYPDYLHIRKETPCDSH